MSDAGEELKRLRAQVESLESRVYEIGSVKEYLDAILMNLPVGVAILEGKDLRYFRINQVLADLNGVPIDDHLGRSVSEVLPNAEGIEENLRRVRETDTAILNREFTVFLPGSPDKPVHLVDSHFPIHVDGEARAIGAMVWDVTERREAEILRKGLVGEILRAQEQTMDLIARELHDGLAQDMAALTYTTAALERVAGGLTETPGLADLVDQCAALTEGLRRAVVEIRRISTNLAPFDLELGLESAVSNHLAMLSARTGVSVDFDAEISDAELSRDVNLTLYRVIQESASNALRHGGSDAIRITITYNGGIVRLEVVDNGCGIDSENPGSGMGMRSMRERAELVGGTFGVQTGSGGTTITVSIPAPGICPDPSSLEEVTS